MNDLYSKLSPVQVVVPVKVLDATTPADAEIDLIGFSGALITISCGAKGGGDTGTIDVTLTHAADNGAGAAGSYAAVTASDVLGPATVTAGVIKNLATGAVSAAIYKVGYVGGKRFIKIAVTETGSNATGTMMSISVIKGFPEVAPAA